MLVDKLLDPLRLLVGRGLGLPVLGTLALGGALGILLGALLRNDLLGFGLGGGALVVADKLSDVGAVAAFLRHDGAAGGRVLAQFTAGRRGGEEFLRHLHGHLVRGGGLGQIGTLVLGLTLSRRAHLALQVRAVAADADVDRAVLVVAEELEGVHAAGVDGLEVILDDRFQAAPARDGLGGGLVGIGIAEVEAGEPLGAVLRAAGDLVEFVLHGRGEFVVDEGVEILLHEPDDGKRDPGRNKGVTARGDVAAVLNGLDDRRVRRRASDAEFFHLLHQAGLGVACRRVGGVAVGSDVAGGQGVALGQLRQVLVVFVLRVRIGAEPTGEGDGAAGGGQLDILAGGRLARDGSGDGRAAGVFHLGGDGALPNELVELELFGIQGAGELAGGGETLACRADRLVGLLGVLHLAVVAARGVGDVVGAI